MKAVFAAQACMAVAAVVLVFPASAAAQSAAAPYPSAVVATAGLAAYWRLGEVSGTVAANAAGQAPGSYLGAPGLGARGALRADADRSARFDGADDELLAGGASIAGAGTVEGWFFWEAGVALMRDSTSAAGWILAYDNGGRIAYRAGGTTFTTALQTADVRDGWHHVTLAVSGAATAFYVDGALVHEGGGAGPTAAVMPWRVMRNGTTTGQYSRGRADEVAVYGTTLDAATVQAHFAAGRDATDKAAPAPPIGLSATAPLGRVELDWSDAAEPDLDGYDVYRATAPSGPFARINASRLSASTYTDTTVTGGTAYVYAVTASDIANNRSPHSGQAVATPPSTEELLRRYSPHLRYEVQETYFADSAAEMTDNFVAGKRQNHLVAGGGTRLAAANPADSLADLSLAYLGDPVYADGRTATSSDYLDAANSFYQQDAQRMRAAGYGDRIHGRVTTVGGKTWLQYWFFSYYNPQNVLGFGVHEGDWEFAQVGLDADGVPDVATFAQHGGGERCSWSDVQKTSAGVPIVYVALASHASYFSAGVNPRGLYPDDYHRGGGYQVRPALDVVTQATPFMAWRGKWGASFTSPVAPRQQGKWGAPNSFNSGASACTVGAAQATATARSQRFRSGVPTPEVSARRVGTRAAVRYRFPALGAGRATRPVTLLVSVSQVGRSDVAAARRVGVGSRDGVLSIRMPPAGAGPYVVRVSAFSAHGARSRLVSAPLEG